MAEGQEQLLETIMGLIMYGGDAKSSAMEAIYAAKSGNFDEAEEKLEAADEALGNAHKSQTNLLTQEASGDSVELSLLLVHGQDHLMNAITFKDLARELIDVYRKLDGQDVSVD
ncbi:PTS system, cellobiose-specific IIA component [Atopostipes suicloacalis DSM 15692]|uniref:PTS system, cellobiose-specific IIA component n=1 Tax=Atopostipes suicloacalis DSM 15692 TaxID=1121025 RepID=A0A1M4YXA9_9LACT|nr:PTS lactose/cellobiose transporter subunit IIA [Atopostipes suicloacalis]SHF10187.1 PTS system, cellobiose-specific IIA component [Atopostipes suicloacalis DSM 15692]